MAEYYLLWSTDYGPDASHKFLETKQFPSSHEIVRHKGCGHVKSPPPRTLVVTYFNKDEVLAPLLWVGHCVIRRDMFDFLPIDDKDSLRLGELMLEDGSRFPDHLTLWTDNQALVRSSQCKLGGPCPHCGIVWYINWSNEKYVTRQSVAGVKVRKSTAGFFIVDNEVAQAIRKEKKARRWRKISLQPIEVLEHATDGLPDDFRESYEYLRGA